MYAKHIIGVTFSLFALTTTTIQASVSSPKAKKQVASKKKKITPKTRKVATMIIKREQPVTLQALDAMRSAIDMIDADIRGNQRNHALLLHGFKKQVQNNVKKDKHIAKLQKKLNSFQKKVAKLSKQFDFISYNVEVIGDELIRHKKKYEPGNDLSALQSLKRLERK